MSVYEEYRKDGKDYWIRKRGDMWKVSYYDVVNKMENHQWFYTYSEGLEFAQIIITDEETNRRFKERELLNNAIAECIEIDIENGLEPYLD